MVGDDTALTFKKLDFVAAVAMGSASMEELGIFITFNGPPNFAPLPPVGKLLLGGASQNVDNNNPEGRLGAR